MSKSNQEPTVPRHFYRQSGSNNWSIRLAPPTAIQHIVGKKQYRVSTGQSDIRRAAPIGHALIAAKLREWNEIALAISEDTPLPAQLSADLIQIICAGRLYSWMTTDDEHRQQGIDDDTLLEIESFCELTDKAMRSILAQGPASKRWPEVVDSILEWCLVNGHEVDPTDPLFPQLVREFAKVEKEAQSRIALRNLGEDAETPPPPQLVGNRLSDVITPFKKYKQSNSGAKHLSTTLNVWTLLIDFTGDIPLNSVASSHIFDFLADRMKAQHKPWSEHRAKSFGKRVLREIFGYARTTGLMTAPNPVDSLEVLPTLSKAEEASRKKPRFPFSNNQLNILFASEWYDPNNLKLFRGKMRADLGARYWIPLIGLFHGNRVSEALQLVVSDFKQDNGILTLSFRTEINDQESNLDALASDMQDTDPTTGAGNARSLKNISTRRVVPLHPTLIKLGFENFLKTRREADGENAWLFPSTVPSADSKNIKLGRAYEQAFLRFVRNYLRFGHGYGNHSFRHQLEDRLREAQSHPDKRWPAGLSQSYTGRKRIREADRQVLESEGSEADYGRGYSPAAMLRFIQTVDFSDVTLPPAFPQWLKARKSGLN